MTDSLEKGLYLVTYNDPVRIMNYGGCLKQDEVLLPSGLRVKGVIHKHVAEYVGTGSLVVTAGQLDEYTNRYIPVAAHTLQNGARALSPCIDLSFTVLGSVGSLVSKLDDEVIASLVSGTTTQVDSSILGYE